MKTKFKEFLNYSLYHYTLVENLDSILEEGIIPNKNINYNKGSNAVFLTNKSSLYNANLPQRLMDEMDRFYDENDKYDNEDKPIVRLTISLKGLNENNFYPDDDYLENRYNWNKAKTFEKQKEESLEIWGSIAYKGIIPLKNIINVDFNYGA